MTTTSAAQRAAEAACERLCVDYAFYADEGRWDELAALFAEDAVMRLFGQTHEGRAAIRANLGTGGERVTVHALSNLRVEIEGPDRASGTCYATVYAAEKDAAPGGPITPIVVGRYVDTYRQTPDGWRIASRSFKALIR